MRKKLGYGLVVAVMCFMLMGCGNSVEVGPVPTITPRPAPTEAPEATPSQAPVGEGNTEETEEQSVYETKRFKEYYENGNDLPQLKVAYQDLFSVGLDVLQIDVTDEKRKELVKTQFDTIGVKEDLSPKFLMDYEATRASGDLTRIALDFSGADVILKFAQENNISIRGPKLISPETPEWAFTKSFSESQVKVETDDTGKEVTTIQYASADVIKKRMENYIKDVMEYCNTNYPGVVISWCVLDDPIEATVKNDANKYNETCGWYQGSSEYVIEAFKLARKYATAEQKLIMSQRVAHEESTRTPLIKLAKLLQAEGLVDGIGIQGTYTASVPGIFPRNDLFAALDALGLEVHVTEFYVDTNDGSREDNTKEKDELLEKCRKRYKGLMSGFVGYEEKNGYDIVSITFDGLTDDTSSINQPKEYYDYDLNETVVGIRSYSYPYLFDEECNPKDAFFAALNDVTISSR